MSLAEQTTDPIDHDAVRALLVAEREELLAALADTTDGSLSEPSGATTGMGETEHLVSAEQLDLSGRIAIRTRAALEEVDAALARLEDGSYGVCVGCGRPIPVPRLEAVPAAARCVGCQSTQEGASS